jgi:hypothetical protein
LATSACASPKGRSEEGRYEEIGGEKLGGEEDSPAVAQGATEAAGHAPDPPAVTDGRVAAGSSKKVPGLRITAVLFLTLRVCNGLHSIKPQKRAPGQPDSEKGYANVSKVERVT